jgi:hypothetical protein
LTTTLDGFELAKKPSHATFPFIGLSHEMNRLVVDMVHSSGPR